ncbi:MAG: type II secretion system protein, partial [bacterium]
MKKFKKFRSLKGLTLVELMIAVGLVGMVTALGFTLLLDVSKEKILLENTSTVRSTASLFQKLSNIFGAQVTHTHFDPLNVVDFSNKKIGSSWTNQSSGKSFSGSVSTESAASLELGNLTNIYVGPTNSIQVLKPDLKEDDLRNLSACSGCASCNTFLNKSSASRTLLKSGIECAPLS